MRPPTGRQGRAADPANLLEAASETAEGNLAAFFARRVEGTVDLPIEKCPHELGMRALVQGHDVFVEGSEARARAQ